MTTPDLTPLIEAVREIDAHPEAWDQTNYGHRTECGTSYCVAGYIIARHPQSRMNWVRSNFFPVEWQLVGVSLPGVEEEELHPESAAEIILGVEPGSLSDLFYMHNTHADIQRIATELANSLGVSWPVPMPQEQEAS